MVWGKLVFVRNSKPQHPGNCCLSGHIHVTDILVIIRERVNKLSSFVSLPLIPC